MEEDKKIIDEKKKEEPTTPADDGEGIQQTTTPLIDIANAAAERMEKANEETARLLKIQEELLIRKELGGRAEAGQEVKKKEETPQEYSKRVMENRL